MTCHGTEGLVKAFPNGDAVSLAVPPDTFGESVHGDLLLCQDCHQGYGELPHPATEAESYRAYSIARYDVCQRCHFSNYTKSLDGVHFDQLDSGNLQAPVCTDCHGAHDVAPPDMPPGRIATTCSQCHSETYAVYRDSVHGHPLVDEQNGDVPTCTYCHGVHNIQQPTSSFRLDVPELCGSCHADEELMAPYGLATDVVDTYLQDFHGVTATLARSQNPDIESFEAVCTDCHGTHNIVSASSPSSPVMKANLTETCRQCHADATDNFPSAWLSHYRPSLSHAPMVFLVKMGYSVLIPVMVAGLAIHVVLNLWRSAINR